MRLSTKATLLEDELVARSRRVATLSQAMRKVFQAEVIVVRVLSQVVRVERG